MNTWISKGTGVSCLILGGLLQFACTGERPGETPWRLRADGADTSRVDASQTGPRGRDAGHPSVDARDASRRDPENIPSGPRIRTPDGWSEPVEVEGECQPRPRPSKECYDFRYPKGPLALRVARHKGLRGQTGIEEACKIAKYTLENGEYRLREQSRVDRDRCGRIRRYGRDTSGHSHFGPPGNPGGRHEVDGRLDEVTFVNYASDGQVDSLEVGYPDRSKLRTARLTYDTDHLLKKVAVEQNVLDAKLGKTRFEYDKCGNRTRAFGLDYHTEEVQSVTERTYGDDDRLDKKVFRRPAEGPAVSVRRFEYRQSEGRAVRITWTGAEGDDETDGAKRVVWLGDDGQRTMSRLYRNDGEGTRWKFEATSLNEYDDKGRLRESRTYYEKHPHRAEAPAKLVTKYEYDCSWSLRR